MTTITLKPALSPTPSALLRYLGCCTIQPVSTHSTYYLHFCKDSNIIMFYHNCYFYCYYYYYHFYCHSYYCIIFTISYSLYRIHCIVFFNSMLSRFIIIAVIVLLRVYMYVCTYVYMCVCVCVCACVLSSFY